MTTYPLTVTSKGNNKRKVTVADASNTPLAFGEIVLTRAHKKATTLYRDPKKTQELAVLDPSMKKMVMTMEMQQPGGGPLGRLVIEGGLTRREFELFDASGASVGRISGEGAGRELAGAAILGPIGSAVAQASYSVSMAGGASIDISRGRGRQASVDKDGDLSADEEQLLLATLVVWAAYALS